MANGVRLVLSGGARRGKKKPAAALLLASPCGFLCLPRRSDLWVVGHLVGGARFENAMNAADTAWRRPPRPPRPRARASSILPALTIFLSH